MKGEDSKRRSLRRRFSVRATCDGIVWTSSVSTHGSYLGYKVMPETMPLKDKLSCKAGDARAEVTDVHL